MKKKAKKKSKSLLIGLVILAFFIILIFINLQSNTSPSNPNTPISSNKNLAEDFSLKLINGTIVKLSDFKGKPVLIWFVATWCSSCWNGAELLAKNYYPKFYELGVIIITIQLYNNLNQPGMSMEEFASRFIGGMKQNWYIGVSDPKTTQLYDPEGYPDVYYIINKQGYIIEKGYVLPNQLERVYQIFRNLSS
jgi:thiol-disulfide isomerase/thioredoxin